LCDGQGPAAERRKAGGGIVIPDDVSLDVNGAIQRARLGSAFCPPPSSAFRVRPPSYPGPLLKDGDMRAPLALATAFTVVPMVVIGCGDASRPTAPSAVTSAAAGPLASSTHPLASQSEKLVNVMDACDPETFNAVIGPGTCVQRQGGVTFSEFIAELTQTQKAGAWHFAPPQSTVGAGQPLLVVNRGGEVHSFTAVASYGGGFIAPLNALSGNTVLAPECATRVGGVLVPGPGFLPGRVMPGGTRTVTLGAAGTVKFQCCIHPWMRSTVRVQ
jgi:plastocyanin